jgi:flagellar biogenesis protein FliO
MWLMNIYRLIPLFFLLFSPTIIAAEEEHPANHQPKEFESIPLHEDKGYEFLNHIEHETDTFQSKFFNMLFILALLIGFMILASWALKRMMKSKLTQLNTSSHMKILETRYLSPRATLYLIEVEDKAFLIAESPTAVTSIAFFPLGNDKPPAPL